jgi:hypothetical protein
METTGDTEPLAGVASGIGNAMQQVEQVPVPRHRRSCSGKFCFELLRTNARSLALAGCFVALAAVAFGALVLTGAFRLPRLRVLPFGDSITEGWGDGSCARKPLAEGGYRYRLYDRLAPIARAHGADLEFVGAMGAGLDAPHGVPELALHHEGHSVS